MSHFTPSIATPADCEALAKLAAQSFSDTFAHLYPPEDLAAHLSVGYDAVYFRDAIAAGDVLLLMREGDQVIAYAKAGEVKLPVDAPLAGAQEIHRLYIHRDYHRQGLGRRMMDYLLALPRFAEAPVLYLGVWEENQKALGLYGSYGFRQIGTYIYKVGSREDHDLILARMRG